MLSIETPRCWHWSLYHDGIFYDPEHGVLDDFPVSGRKYFWEIKRISDKSFAKADRKYYYGGELGAIYSKEKTVFRTWSPYAESIKLNLYTDCICDDFISCPMKNTGNVWETEIKGDFEGFYYTYTVRIYGTEHETIDIYAKSAGVNGKRGMIFDSKKTNPENWDKSSPVVLENYNDAVIYEMHIRDFSTDISGDFRYRGKFLSFCEDNERLDYIKSLGITHIHLLPVMDFASVDEANPSFNWGYDPLNYNIPEGSYSTDPFDGRKRVKELKELILSAHKKNLGIILDVVYNHTFSAENSPFFKIFPHYFHRHDENGFSNGSGCGNEIATERLMMRRFICDSLCYIAEEYKIDGFRFDLMGLMDIKTLNLCAERLKLINPNIILYGEGWTGGISSLDEKFRAMQKNAGLLPDFAMFSDYIRDTVKGSVFNDLDTGYVNGNHIGAYERMKSALCGNTGYMPINYVECHDNLTFYDKLKISMPCADEDDIISADKMGAAIIILSQGIPFIQAGQEFLRSKPTDGGYEHNSYKSPDSVNSIKWDNLTKYRDISDYYRGLFAIRKKYPCFRRADKINFRDTDNGIIIMNTGNFIFIINPTDGDFEINIGGEILADKHKASDMPVYVTENNSICERKGIILIHLTAQKNK
ncbi:MAG: type I pullulanase [Ruminococcus sp.]|nr:type I pullulanase [Ruminococcus sp.]